MNARPDDHLADPSLGPTVQVGETDPETRKANEALKAKDIQRNRETLKKQVVEQCKKHKGRAADAKLINDCLEASGGKTDPASCQKFADCFGKFLKEKSK